MGAFLAGLLERARGTQPTVAPRRRSAFEPVALEPPAGSTSGGPAADVNRIVDANPAGAGQSPAGGRMPHAAGRVPAAGSPGAAGFAGAMTPAAPIGGGRAPADATASRSAIVPGEGTESAPDTGGRAPRRKGHAVDAADAAASEPAASGPAPRRPEIANRSGPHSAEEPAVPAQAFTTVPVVRVEADRVSVARGAESPVRGGREDVAQPAVPEPAIAARASAARRGSVEAAAVTPDPTERERASSPNIERAPAPASLDPRETPRAPAPAAAHREPVRSPPDAPPPRAPFMRGPDERRRLEEPNEAAPVIHVTIGRVEVRATPPAPPPLPEVPRWQAPVLGLEEFLRRERGRS